MLTLPADLTHERAVPTMLALSQALSREADASVVVDASGLKIFDSSALAVLLACRREALAKGKTFAVMGLHTRLRQLAGLYGVEPLLPVAA